MRYILLFVVFFFTSCNPCSRLEKLAAKCPGALQSDTVVIRDTIYIPTLERDTAWTLQTDTFIVKEGNVTVKLVKEKESIRVNVKQAADTIFIEKKIAVDKIVIQKELPTWAKLAAWFIGAFLFALLFGQIVKRKKNEKNI